MDAPRKYPVGRQVFPELVEGGFLYVDKTRYIWDMAHTGGKYYFLSRPRRFGKTLLVSTMEAYFQGRRELFEGLALGRLETEWVSHPVLRFDLSTVKCVNVDTLKMRLADVITHIESAFGYEGSGFDFAGRIAACVRRATAQMGEQAVILVDEYDAPLLNVMHDAEMLARFREVMREFYAPLKALEADVRFVFLTGVSKFSQLSVFSELNNIQNVSMDLEYAAVCGITQDELAGSLGSDVAGLAERMGLSVDEAFGALKRTYDGYHFCAGSPDVYNPFSVISAFQKGRLGSFWFESGTPTALVNMLASRDFPPQELEGVSASAMAFDAPTESMATPVPFMYQSGYLTIKGYDALLDSYTLGIPNAEVREGLYEVLLPAYSRTSAVESSGFLANFTRAVLYDGDMDAALSLLRAYMASFPYDMAPRDEKGFQNILYLIFSLVGSKISCEVRTSRGRVDAVIEVPSGVYVIELKYARLGASVTPKEALGQIDEKGYLVPWEADGRPVYKVSVVYSEEEGTISDNWVIERTR